MAKILVVDDKVDDLRTMESLLKSEGYEVSIVTDGASALEVSSNENFDLVLIDIIMPTLSGYELLKLMRKRFDRKMKMVYVSIVPKKEVVMDDVDDFIQKPFTPESFLGVVKKQLNGKRKN